MVQPFVGEIRIFAGTFAPRGWALCDGQLINVSENEALFSVLGSVYGGNGRTTFGLPDLRGRLPVHQGAGPGLGPRQIGASGGAETETLTSSELARHNHAFHVSGNNGDSGAPVGNVPALAPVNAYSDTAPTLAFASSAITEAAGGGGDHDNVMPFTVLNFIIALTGTFPTRN